MRSLLFVSLLALSGCVSIKPGHLVPDPGAPVPASTVRYRPPDSTDIFKASLDIRDHHLTGLLLIKNMHSAPPGSATEDYRAVFMNEIGMTFFDLELKAGSMRMVSCFPSLDRKALFRILETDLRVLLGQVDPHPCKKYRQDSTNYLATGGKSGRYKSWQCWSQGGDTLFVQTAKSTPADPVRMVFSQYTDGSPTRISLENKVIKMKMQLRRIR